MEKRQKSIFLFLSKLFELFSKIVVFKHNLYHDENYNFTYKDFPELLTANFKASIHCRIELL